MTDAELAALARNAIYDRDFRPHRKDFLPQHIAAWSPERALTALAVIAAARKSGSAMATHDDDDITRRAIATWDALP